MAELKDVRSSSPTRTPKSQLAAEQSSTEGCCIPPKKDTLHPRAKENPQKDSRRSAITFKIKSHIHHRCSEGANRTLCTPGPRERSNDPHKRLSQTCLCVFESLLWRHGSAVTSRGDRRSVCSSYWRCGIWHKSFWRRLPLAIL